jgi:hypothetical protein
MILWIIDPLLGKDLETHNETTTVAKNRRGNTPLKWWKRCFTIGPCKVVIRKTIVATQ